MAANQKKNVTRKLNLAPITLPGRQPGDGNGGASRANGERKVALYWLNVGFQAEDGTLLQLPLGIPMDDLRAKPIPKLNEDGSNRDFRDQRIAEAQMLEQFMAALATLSPGEAIDVPGMTGQIRMRKEENVSDEEISENRFLSAIPQFAVNK